MPKRSVVCIRCQDQKDIYVHRHGYLEPQALAEFERDGWQYLKGRKGQCPTCQISSTLTARY